MVDNKKFTISPAESVKLIVKTALEEGITDHGQIAHILGQCEHETSWTFSKEIDGESQAIKYGYSGGGRYCGRGYIQITHDYNYKSFGKLLGVGDQFYNDPGSVSEPTVAAKIAVIGVRDDLFTKHGKKLAAYCNNGSNDFKQARRLVNGYREEQAINGDRLAKKWLAQMPALVNGAEPDPNALPTNTGAGGASTASDLQSGSVSTSAQSLGITSLSVGTCTEIFPIEFSLKEALHYTGCFSRKIVAAVGGNSNLGSAAPGMQINGASHFNIADFNPTVPICDGCLGFPFKKDIRITSPFCQRRISKSSGRTYYHSGTDYGGFEGDEVIAVADGTVVTPLVSGGYNPGLVDIVHEQLGNLLSRSAHIIPSVQPGSKVKQGDVIGKVGPYPSGGPHLHLELRKDKGAGGSAFSEAECKSKFLDPALFCKRS